MFLFDIICDDPILDSKLYIEKYVLNKNYLNRIIGFYAKNEDDNYNFKIRDLKDSRNKKGARVDQAGTKDILLKLNEIIENSQYTIERIENDNKEKHKNKIVFRSSSQEEPFILNKNQIIVLMEILILYFNDLKKGGKIWFVNYEQILINKYCTKIYNSYQYIHVLIYIVPTNIYKY